MAKFRFELESLLKARRLAEQARQRAVAAIEQDRMKLEQSLRDLQRQISDGKHAMQSGLVGLVQADQLRMHAASTMHTMRAAQRVVLELAGVHRRLDAARAALIEAAQHRRAVEILRERRYEQWKAQQDKLENDALDELAVIAAARRRDLPNST
jgi:flagellar FliJ protein